MNRDLKTEEINVVEEIHRDVDYLHFMKSRWDIDFKGGTFGKKAREAGIDSNQYFDDPIWTEYSEDDYNKSSKNN